MSSPPLRGRPSLRRIHAAQAAQAARPVLGASLALLALASAPPQDRLAAHFEPEEELRRSFSEETSWALDTVAMTIDGEEVEQDVPPVEGRMTRSSVLVDVVRDTLPSPAGQRPAVLVRAFEELAGASELSFGQGSARERYETSRESALEGARVVFTWDEEDEAYAAEWDEDAPGPDGLLEGLAPEGDFTRFLPDHEVEAGDTWDVPAAALSDALRPGGEVALHVEEASAGSLFGAPSSVILASGSISVGEAAAELEGSLLAEYAGLVEEDGRRVARIEVELEVTGESELGESLRAALERMEERSSGAELSLELELEGTAVLLWDVERGRALSFELQGEVLIAGELAWEDELLGTTTATTAEFEVSGTTLLRADVD